MLILEKVTEDKEFREKGRLKRESHQKEAKCAAGESIVLLMGHWS